MQDQDPPDPPDTSNPPDPSDPYDLNDPPPQSDPAPGIEPTPQGDVPSYVALNCSACGYNLTGIAISGTCPECGAPVERSLQVASRAQQNGMALTSMIMGIVSIPTSTCCCGPIGMVLAILGLTFGIMALSQIKTGAYTPGSRGMAIAGISCSGAAMLLFLIIIGFNIVMSL